MNKQIGSFWKDNSNLNYYRIEELIEGGYGITAYDNELKHAYTTIVHAEALQADVKMTTGERIMFERMISEWGYE